jgi:hypothetical protein
MNWIGSLTRVKIRLGLGSRHLVCLPVPPPDPEHQVATSWCGRCLPLVYRVSTPGPELGRSPRTVKAFREATNGILGGTSARLSPEPCSTISNDSRLADLSAQICPASRAIIHLLPGNEHTTSTHGAAKIRFYRVSRGVLLIEEFSCR